MGNEAAWSRLARTRRGTLSPCSCQANSTSLGPLGIGAEIISPTLPLIRLGNESSLISAMVNDTTLADSRRGFAFRSPPGAWEDPGTCLGPPWGYPIIILLVSFYYPTHRPVQSA